MHVELPGFWQIQFHQRCFDISPWKCCGQIWHLHMSGSSVLTSSLLVYFIVLLCCNKQYTLGHGGAKTYSYSYLEIQSLQIRIHDWHPQGQGCITTWRRRFGAVFLYRVEPTPNKIEICVTRREREHFTKCCRIKDFYNYRSRSRTGSENGYKQVAN